MLKKIKRKPKQFETNMTSMRVIHYFRKIPYKLIVKTQQERLTI